MSNNNNNNNNKILVIVIAISLFAGTIATVSFYNDNNKIQAQSTTCRPSVIIQVGLWNATTNSSYLGVIMLDGYVKSSSAQTNENETFGVMTFNMQVRQCFLGHEYSGLVNGTEFTGRIKSLTDPNSVWVDVTNATS